MTAPRPLLSCRVGVAIVAYNTKRFWPRLKNALEAQTFGDWRLIIVDNASDPAERLRLDQLPPGAELIQSEVNLGFAAANNLAASILGAEFLALVNPDAFPEPTWLDELVAAAGRWPQAAAFGSLQVLAHDPSIGDGNGDEMHALGIPYRAQARRRLVRPAPEGECFSVCAAAALFRMADFRAMGGFDEKFGAYCEDVDLCYRLRLIGRVSVQVPRALAHHVSGGSAPADSPYAVFHGRRNRLWTFVKNTPPLLFWPILPLHLAATMAQLLVSPTKRSGGAGWRALAAALAGLPKVWPQRRSVQRGRTASTIEIARALMWSPLALWTRSSKRRKAAGHEPPQTNMARELSSN